MSMVKWLKFARWNVHQPSYRSVGYVKFHGVYMELVDTGHRERRFDGKPDTNIIYEYMFDENIFDDGVQVYRYCDSLNSRRDE